jgi:hypothetical protein
VVVTPEGRVRSVIGVVVAVWFHVFIRRQDNITSNVGVEASRRAAQKILFIVSGSHDAKGDSNGRSSNRGSGNNRTIAFAVGQRPRVLGAAGAISVSVALIFVARVAFSPRRPSPPTSRITYYTMHADGHFLVVCSKARMAQGGCQLALAEIY